MKKIIFLFIGIFLFQFTHAQIIKDVTTWSNHVTKVKDGEYDLVITCKLKPDWHIWSMNPGGDGLLYPPSISFAKNNAYTLVGKVKEKGKLINEEFPGTDGITHYYENEVIYTQRIKAKENTDITSTIKYQTCDHANCLAPETKKFTFKIEDIEKVKKDTVAAAQTSSDMLANQSSSTDTLAATVQSTQRTDSNISSANEQNNTDAQDSNLQTAEINPAAAKSDTDKPRSNWMLLLEGIGGGLLSIITPCVFAMLPMTVSFFLKRTKDRKSGIKVALQYSLSLIIIFALLGLLLTLVNNKNVLYEISSHWVTNLFFFIIFLIFGFSFLGAFEITLPSKWSTFTDSKANMNSISGIFFMALTLAIVSFSCTAPFIGGLISEISKGAKIGPLFGFTGYGIGLALPFTLFAIFPQLLNALNKQGGWLNAVKVVFGFVELALAFKFLSNSDLQMGWRLLDREIFIAIWVVIAIATSLYLFGIIRFSHDSDLPKNHHEVKYLTVTRTVFALIFLAFGLYLLPGMWGAPLNGMGAFVPPMGTQDFVLSGQSNSTVGASEKHENKNLYASAFQIYEPEVVKKYGMNTYFDYHEALKAAKEQHKPIMLDFTGITCVNCRKMETQVWSNEEVFKRMKEKFIVVSLFCDATQIAIPENEYYQSSFLGTMVKNLGQKNADIQATKYNSNTQPYYFFIDENEKLLAPNGYGYNPDASKFVSHLDQVLAAYNQ
ncbi:MAG: cytochrome c biogenesis protein CcdA [Chitinophagaceae bacterium]